MQSSLGQLASMEEGLRTKTLLFLHIHKTAGTTLHRIIEKFPGGASASVAVRRLATLHSELKSSQNTATKTLGAYEKDLGLKQPDVK